MIDTLEIDIPFRDEFVSRSISDPDSGYIDPKNLCVKLSSQDISFNGTEFVASDLRTCFESLPSSYSGLAMKVYNNGLNSDPFVRLKGSIAKISQGHNVYGVDTITVGVKNFIYILGLAYPELLSKLDLHLAEISSIDITNSVFEPDHKYQHYFIDHLQTLSNGQLKNRGSSYETTAYFGSKNSRLRKIKVYIKRFEVERQIEDSKKKKLDSSIIDILENVLLEDYTQSAIRFEVTLKKRWLERNGIPTKVVDACRLFTPQYVQNLFKKSTADLFSSLAGQRLKIMNDSNVYKNICLTHCSTSAKTGKSSLVKANRIYSFYLLLKSEGFENVRSAGMYGRHQFNRNISDLVASGISKSVLQSLRNDSNVVYLPFVRYLSIDYSKQLPEGYRPPRELYAA